VKKKKKEKRSDHRMAKVENENMKVSERRKIKSGVKCCVFVGLLREKPRI
jgi:hypothetical protein